jgi:hypothetical protein
MSVSTAAGSWADAKTSPCLISKSVAESVLLKEIEIPVLNTGD